MTITAERIVDVILNTYATTRGTNAGDGPTIAEAQSILDTIRAEATAAAYGAAAAKCLGARYAPIDIGGDLVLDPLQGAGLAALIERLTPADATAWLADRDAAQFKAGQEAALKGAVKGWAVMHGDYFFSAGQHRNEFLLPGETIRPCLILVGEGE